MEKACLQAIRKKIKNDPFFLVKILYPQYEFKNFHREWFYQALQSEEDICLGPRGFAKSTVRVVISSIWRIIENPNISILITSNTNFQAIHFATEIKKLIETNMILRILYPYIAPGKKWTDNDFTVVGCTEIKKEGTIMALGYGGALTGFHFDNIIIDDIVDFENSRTKLQRKKLEDWLGMTLFPMLKQNGKISWNGTRYHQDDQYGKLLKRNIISNFKTHKAIQDDGTSLWPELFSIDRLKKIKDDIGSIYFNAQYQNDVTLMAAGKIFKREWFRYIDKIPENLAIYQTCDLAISQSEKADYFVILTFGIDKDGNIYILDILRGRYSWNEQKKISRDNYLKWKNKGLRWLGIESVQYQRVLGQELNVFPDMSIKNLKAEKDKVTRAMPMSAKYESGKVFHYTEIDILEEFENELCSFDEGEHDDMVDCVSYIPQCISGIPTFYVLD